MKHHCFARMSVGLGNIKSNKTAVNLEWSDSMPRVRRLQMKCRIIARNTFMSKFNMQKSAHLVNHHNKFKKHEETLKKQHCLLL